MPAKKKPHVEPAAKKTGEDLFEEIKAIVASATPDQEEDLLILLTEESDEVWTDRLAEVQGTGLEGEDDPEEGSFGGETAQDSDEDDEEADGYDEFGDHSAA
jgi:hypothetical protein